MMWFFGNKKKKLAEQKKHEELEKQARLEAAKAEEERIKREAEERARLEIYKKTDKTVDTVVKEQTETPKKPSPKKTAAPTAEAKKTPSGKYEIYPEAGLYKYRLKASNGEILAVSFGYASKSGAKSGIETFRKAVEAGHFEMSTDKAGFSHYDLFDARGARVILIGEFYKTEKLAESAVESVKKFYTTDKVIELKEIPSAEIREEVVPKQKIAENPNGKYHLVKENAKTYYVKLLASNGQVLLVSQKYASKQSAVNGLEAIQNAIKNQNFTVAWDKQNRYQYNLYTDNKQLIVSGETYPVKQHCLSAIQSVLRFAGQAKLSEVNENA